jgi:hypothetical protein
MRRPAPAPKTPVAPTLFRRICAWCHADLGALWPDSQTNSYGICPACSQRYFPDLYEPDASIPLTPAELERSGRDEEAPADDVEPGTDQRRAVRSVGDYEV